MAITQRKRSLADESISVSKGDVKDSPEKLGELKEKEGDVKSQKEKKAGFIKTTIAELKKVEWPTWKYTVTWVGIVIVFTIVMSIALGFFDHIFKTNMEYINCTSSYKIEPEVADKDYKECTQNLFNNLILRGE